MLNFNSCKRTLITGSALLFVIFLAFATTMVVLAHGANIDYSATVGVEIVAAYDSGDAMAEAQVLVYAPNDLSKAWLTGTTDDEGRFFFTPDPEIPGTWDVQVRQGGHGDIVHIPIGEGAMSSGGGGGFTTMQIVLMSASVIWGFVGTALYFSGRKA